MSITFFIKHIIYILKIMADWWNGQSYGYDQVGATDPYYNLRSTRYGVSPSEIRNINTPVHDHVYKNPYEEMRINSKCQELLMDMRNNEDEVRKLKAELQSLSVKPSDLKSNPTIEGFMGKDMKDSNVLLMILIVVVFVVLQMQIQQTNDLLKMIIFSQKKPT
jgi:hypothetical protein